MKGSSQAGEKLKTWVDEGEDKDEKNGWGENENASDCKLTIQATEFKV